MTFSTHMWPPEQSLFLSGPYKPALHVSTLAHDTLIVSVFVLCDTRVKVNGAFS
jgi:hypothetical protein